MKKLSSSTARQQAPVRGGIGLGAIRPAGSDGSISAGLSRFHLHLMASPLAEALNLRGTSDAVADGLT
jgi:hypothetical protein